MLTRNIIVTARPLDEHAILFDILLSVRQMKTYTNLTIKITIFS